MVPPPRVHLCLAALAVLAVPSGAQVRLDPALPRYQKVSGVSGVVQSVGSDSMNNLIALWGEGFLRRYPNVRIEIEGKGSSTAPPALIAGTATFGPMSRAMKVRELDDFEAAHGYPPTALAVATDMLAVYVHKDNPIVRSGLTLRQLDAIFSKTRRGGGLREVRTWGELGLGAEWADKTISLYGRNSASGTYGYFKQQVLFGGDYKDEVKEQPGSSSLILGVGNDRYAIGYSGIAYETAEVATVPLAREVDDEFLQPDLGTAGRYPLSRSLVVYVNHRPHTPLDPLRREFLRFVYSREGQAVVAKDGYLPLSFALSRRELQRIGVELRRAEVEGQGR